MGARRSDRKGSKPPAPKRLAWVRDPAPGRSRQPQRAASAGHPLEDRLARSELLRRAALRELARARRALAELSRAGRSSSALATAGAQLMFEGDAHAVCEVLCRELSRLGLRSAVLTRTDGAETADFRYEATSFQPRLQRVVESALQRPLAEISLNPKAAPLLGRVLRTGCAVQSSAPEVAVRQLLACDASRSHRLTRLLALGRVVVAPLRWQDRISGLLVVASPGLRRGDAVAVDAFAAQASIALEKAFLQGELQRERAHLSSEVARRTEALRRAVEALKEVDRRKDNFLANVSHELRTPLVTVLGYTGLLLSGKLGELAPPQREGLEIVAASGRRLRAFIDELLDLSRQELTRDRLELAPVEVGDLLRQAALGLAPRFQELGLRVRCRVAPGTPPVRGDRDKLLQVLVNLLMNAAEHGRSAGRVHLAAARGGRAQVVVAVHDDGVGIPAEHLAHLFDRLYQVGDATGPRGPGSGLGLGLSIARTIVRAHGGEITVSSRPGHGACFRFSLPAALPPTPG